MLSDCDQIKSQSSCRVKAGPAPSPGPGPGRSSWSFLVHSVHRANQVNQRLSVMHQHLSILHGGSKLLKVSFNNMEPPGAGLARRSSPSRRSKTALSASNVFSVTLSRLLSLYCSCSDCSCSIILHRSKLRQTSLFQCQHVIPHVDTC